MARFQNELPDYLIKELEQVEKNTKKIFGDMCEAGAKVVKANVIKNMKKSFGATETLEKGLLITDIYETPSDGGINVKVGFWGYDGIPTKKNPKGTAYSLMAMAREYGTYGSNPKSGYTPKEGKKMPKGEDKKPFFRQSFKKKEIEAEMQKVLDKAFDKYSKG